MGVGASLTIWVGAFPLEADKIEPTVIFVKLGAIWGMLSWAATRLTNVAPVSRATEGHKKITTE